MPDREEGIKADAMPTKDFFIKMLVKDIELIPSIIDLVDNSIDGARRLRQDGHYSGLEVSVTIDKNQFSIVDNCGGIDLEIAKHYAFRFGRGPGMKPLDHSLGQFGVGMKRALFKLGNRFRIESTWKRSHFVLDVDVDEWSKPDREWEFVFEEAEVVSVVPPDQTGTKIVVTELHEGVSKEFEDGFFQSRLVNQIREKHQASMTAGLVIQLNQIPLSPIVPELVESPKLKSAYFERTVGKGPEEVKIRIYAGVAKSHNEERAGWYLYCNGREVLGADRTLVTGWGEQGGKLIPQYHNQFNKFRGYVFLESRDGKLLPWNTTKTGVEVEAPLFRFVRQEAINLMRPVINFLNYLKEEGSNKATAKRPLKIAFEAAQPVTLDSIRAPRTFRYPQRAPKPKEPVRRITYAKPIGEYEKVRRSLKVETPTEVGERTFDYYLQAECE